MTHDQIVGLTTRELRAILRSTNPNTTRFALEVCWAQDEMDRRTSRTNLNDGVKYTEALEIINQSETGLKRVLSDGERRDLLIANTDWHDAEISALVNAVHYNETHHVQNPRHRFAS